MKTMGYLLAGLLLLCSCAQKQSTVVSLTSGKAQGVYADSVYSFKGIPYAKAARFMPPQQRWLGTQCGHSTPTDISARKPPYRKETTSSRCVRLLPRERIA